MLFPLRWQRDGKPACARLPSVQTWQTIVGQQRARTAFINALQSQRLPHAYMVSGASAVTRQAVTFAMAASINCLQPASVGDACGHCASCHKIANATHPDIIVLAGSGASAQIPIETVRDMIVRLALLPNEANTRVIIVHEATALAGPAANALLKTLEEPPARTMFILATAAPDQLLPTIRSRCQRLRLSGSDDDEVGDNERVDALTARVLAFCNDDAASAKEPTSDLAAAIAEKIVDVKNAHLAVVENVAQQLGERAKQAALAGNLVAAKRDSRRATAALQWHFSMRVHNAHPFLATETLLGELRDPL
jgi:DNA polymerase III delta' subunit